MDNIKVFVKCFNQHEYHTSMFTAVFRHSFKRRIQTVIEILHFESVLTNFQITELFPFQDLTLKDIYL